MKDLPYIFAAYADVDGHIEKQRQQGRADGELRQAINAQAYFLLSWGQLEFEIDARCRDAVRRRRSHADWRTRRAWDLYNPDEARFSGLSFEGRAMLVLDSRAGRGSPFALVIRYYGIRNQIAHGRLQATRINVSAFVADCFIIQAALHRSA